MTLFSAKIVSKCAALDKVWYKPSLSYIIIKQFPLDN